MLFFMYLQIVNSSQMARYESDVRNWELLKTQQDQEFTITEQNAHEAHKMGAESPLKNMQLKNAERVSTPSELDFKHYEVSLHSFCSITPSFPCWDLVRLKQKLKNKKYTFFIFGSSGKTKNRSNITNFLMPPLDSSQNVI